MTDDEIILLGDYCEGILRNDLFDVVVKQFELQCFIHWANTDPKNIKEREAIFAQRSALNEFIGHMKAIVSQRDETHKRNEALSQGDAHIEGID